MSDATTLSMDVGGSHIKAALVDERGRVLSDRAKVDTPDDLAPATLVDSLVRIAKDLSDGKTFSRVSVGVNGLVHAGVVYSIPITKNPAFRGLRLGEDLSRRLGRPVRVMNDAEMQGLGVVRGKGVELVITLGTGLGTALFIDGQLGPHLQFVPSPACDTEHRGGDYGNEAFESIGRKRWRKRVRKLVDVLQNLTNYDQLYVGGGNAEELEHDLPDNVTIIDNMAALAGGARAWEWNVKQP
jgi:polyphosphate glucokinase